MKWLFAGAFVVALLASPRTSMAASEIFTGNVRDAAGDTPIAGAIVCGTQWDGTQRVSPDLSHCQTTGADGAFGVSAVLFEDSGQKGEIIVSAPGYVTKSEQEPSSNTTGLIITLISIASLTDNPDYPWWEAGFTGCGSCHNDQTNEWELTSHARAAKNPTVIQMYDGTDAEGNADVQPGYAIENSDAGDCAACHAPLAWWENGGPVAMDAITDEIHNEGVNCEACHKIRSVIPNGKSGVDGSITMFRPPIEFSDGLGSYFPFAFGSFPNVIATPMAVSYSQERARGRFCAGCHQYENQHGTAIINTYEEWASVGDTETIQQCQDCHMQDAHGHELVDEREFLVAEQAERDLHAAVRDSKDLYSHRFFSGPELAPYALSIDSEAFQQGNELVVNVSVTNTGANHNVPTGMPFREFIIFVEAATSSGALLNQIKGPTMPEQAGDYADEPGLFLARILGDARGPTHEFWNATRVVRDTTLSLGERRETAFAFDVDREEDVTVSVRVIYRRFTKSLADAKGWETGDEIVLEPQHPLTVVPVGCGCQGSEATGAMALLGIALLLVARRRRREN